MRHTDYSGIFTYGLTALGRETSIPPPKLQLYFMIYRSLQTDVMMGVAEE